MARKEEKEKKILEEIAQLERWHGYVKYDEVADIIVQAIFGKPYLVATRPHCWNRAEVENITEDEFRIMAMVMKAMVNKGLIKPSKSRAMFKILF